VTHELEQALCPMFSALIIRAFLSLESGASDAM
jgi:hypothetical protein